MQSIHGGRTMSKERQENASFGGGQVKAIDECRSDGWSLGSSFLEESMAVWNP